MHPLPDNLRADVLLNRKQIADECSRYFYPLTERKARELPLAWRYISGMACAPRGEVFALLAKTRDEASYETRRNCRAARAALLAEQLR